jgi:hypothetical protein
MYNYYAIIQMLVSDYFFGLKNRLRYQLFFYFIDKVSVGIVEKTLKNK